MKYVSLYFAGKLKYAQMKKTIVWTAIAACLFTMDVFAQKIKGSDTCLPLTQTEAEYFMNKEKNAKVTVTGGGSGVGISALLEGTTDIAMTSRNDPRAIGGDLYGKDTKLEGSRRTGHENRGLLARDLFRYLRVL